MAPLQAPTAAADHQWPIQNQWPAQAQWPAEPQRVQPGYGDGFDGAQSYGGYQDAYQGQATQSQVRYEDYPAYNEPPGYQDYPAYQQETGYQTPGNGYAQLPDGFDNYAHEYRDPRPSGPMLSAPDQPAWNDFGAGPDGDSGGRTPRRGGRGVIVGAVMGLLAAGVAIGIATLAAAFFRPQASPIIAVGEAFIDRTPPALKNFAVQKFGENDKTMLLLGMYVTIALLAMAIGVLARRRVPIGVVGIAVFGLFGAYVAYTRPASKFSDIIPSIIGGIAGVAALLWLSNAATPEPVPVRAMGGPGYQWADGGIA
jgi:hypothetical protein